MPIMTTLHWRGPTRDKMTDTVAARDTVLRRTVKDTPLHHRPLLFRFTDVNRRANPTAAAAAAADTNSPAADVIIA